jgi:hypothetical protein
LVGDTGFQPQVATWGFRFFKGQYCDPSRGGREALWKLPQLWKSTKDAFGNFLWLISTSCLEKPPLKNSLRLSHSYHSADGGVYPTEMELVGGTTQHFFYSLDARQFLMSGTSRPFGSMSSRRRMAFS